MYISSISKRSYPLRGSSSFKWLVTGTAVEVFRFQKSDAKITIFWFIEIHKCNYIFTFVSFGSKIFQSLYGYSIRENYYNSFKACGEDVNKIDVNCIYKTALQIIVYAL
jgi:hypothetical protein